MLIIFYFNVENSQAKGETKPPSRSRKFSLLTGVALLATSGLLVDVADIAKPVSLKFGLPICEILPKIFFSCLTFVQKTKIPFSNIIKERKKYVAEFRSSIN